MHLVAQFINNSNAANHRGEHAVAVQLCKQALKRAPSSPEAWYNLGVGLLGLGQRPAAIGALEKARIYALGSADAQNSIGLQFLEAGAQQEAELCFNRSITLDPQNAFPFSNLGKLRAHQYQLEDAERLFRQAISLLPSNAALYLNLGGVLNAQRNFSAAEVVCRKAIELDDTQPEAWSNFGNTLYGQKRYEAAADCFSRALEKNPGEPFLLGKTLHARMRICDWNSLENNLSLLFQKISLGEKASEPFPILALTTDLAMQRKVAEICTKANSQGQKRLSAIRKHVKRNKIRVGYFSADFHHHATTYLMAELFERHNKDSFEFIGFSFGPDSNDGMRRRVVAALDQFIDVRGLSDKAVAELSRSLEVDIAVDLKGYTEDCRPGIFAYRAAPIQVSYLGYPGTMGAEYIDYLIADEVIIPPAHQCYYTEAIAYLPDCYQVNDASKKISGRTFLREELGLPSSCFVYCCFNNNYKITPSTFDSWMRILKKVENSVLWLFEDNPTAAENLRKEACSRGVSPARLVFAKRLPLDEHLARHRVADLCIDTLPYNAHTTASDALWAGLPVLTCIGEAFPSRVAASLLSAIDLPELITRSAHEFETLAVELATNAPLLNRLKEKLEKNRLTTPLFDTPTFAKHIEAAYTAMYERYQLGLPPEHFHVSRQ